jgi:hypothetical protein
VTATLPTLNAGYNYYLFEMTGTFTNSTNAVLFPNQMFAKVAFAPNLNNWTRIYPTSPASFNTFLNGYSLEVPAGSSAIYSGSGSLESSSPPTLAGESVQVMWNDPRNVAYCPAPVKG